MIEYRVSQENKPGEPGWASALIRVPALIVCSHFAIRTTPVMHPAGEGMMMESFVLDHIHTGMRMHGGGGALWQATEKECSAMAESIASIPVPWSSSSVKDIEAAMAEVKGVPKFLTKARVAAAEGKSIIWEETL